ncbi:alpha/beta fold hydrolase [Pseudonocardia sp. TRM90224]|uniref:alpha/beta fold hydrolase n=1 Tax=Pseudonocardia sp. TRM90224 TaxID=2812678 RepID=UPI001E4CE4A6|nr:alpha/beta fold hydrolase [Pseudonocardia sp. TRM90224]
MADLDAPLVHLAGYTTEAAARAATAFAERSGALLAQALSTPPAAGAARGLLWWNTVLDRRPPRWHTPAETVLTTPFAHLRDVTAPGDADAAVVPTLVLPPQAGHSSHVVDFAPAQSQLRTIAAAGLTRLYVLEWRAATTATRDVTITDYVEVVDRAVRHMGGRANLVGDCQGGWLAAVYAALHPERVHTLTLAGAPIDFHAGESVVASSTRVLTGALGLAPYRTLVALNGGTMPGAAALANFIAIQPQAEVSRQLDLLLNITDTAHVARYRAFEDWFKHTQDIPGAFYLWLVEHLFHGNELVAGTLQVGDRRVDMSAITCPLFLLAGATDHITPAAQLFAAAAVVGTPPGLVTRRTAAGGHLGLFMGRDALRDDWPALMGAVRAFSDT